VVGACVSSGAFNLAASAAPRVVAGDEHTCVAVDSPTARIYCWGAADRGQLGRPSAEAAAPCPTEITALSGLGVAGISAGQAHTCAVTTGGEVWCWGENDLGQLGRTPVAGDHAPMAVAGLSGIAVAAGGRHTCANPMPPARLVCWGDNTFGQVDGSSGGAFQPTPVEVMGQSFPWVGPFLGDRHGCAPDAMGAALRCWGDDSSGQLGASPASGPGAAGDSHTCNLEPGGLPHCWGDNARGQLGDGTRTSRRARALVSGLPATRTLALAASGDHSCASIDPGNVYCWGDNGVGQTAPGGPPVVDTATSVTPGRQVAVGTPHACAVDFAGDILCWGDNTKGQLGDGTIVPRSGVITVRAP
jgi:alpha-tubulin suppressor-like RCC1 family protein